jgi:hypothetical protein
VVEVAVVSAVLVVEFEVEKEQDVKSNIATLQKISNNPIVVRFIVPPIFLINFQNEG